MRTSCLFSFLLICQLSFSQDMKAKLGTAINNLEADAQFKHAIISMYVVDGKTGRTVYDKNGQIGLAPASCQKVVTSVTAFEILGPDYKYITPLRIYTGGDSIRLFVDGSGDPTLGSWRWNNTNMDSVYKAIFEALTNKKISTLGCDIGFYFGKNFTFQPVPDGWVWQDIGNYYGAGAWAFNWHENQYSIILNSENKQGNTEIKNFDPVSATMPIQNFIFQGKQGSGDNAYLYSAPYSDVTFATGTIPHGEKQFTISGSMSNPSNVFNRGLKAYLNNNGITISNGKNFSFLMTRLKSFEIIDSIISPSLDSINYWFLKKSINLYGEAFVKTIAYEKIKIGSTDSGVNVIKDFWADKGIERSALKIIDGSGLSPANRLTTNALVRILQYAKQRPWFSSFYNALPEMNGIKMKDGYIGGVRSYTGYVKSATGAEYIFSFIVNNFDGNPSSAKEKIWKVLDLLK